MEMPLHPSAIDIALRLFLTVVAGALIGINREAGGHSAGFRTTVLAALAASLAMILANAMLEVGGKTPVSFATMDPMRLPLGILTGMGFIGGGAILKHGNTISGVTTAATLWAVTVVGLCFGSGNLVLGCVGTGLILLTLIGFKWVDVRVARKRRAHVVIAGTRDAPTLSQFYDTLRTAGYRANFLGESDAGNNRRRLTFEVLWEQTEIDGKPPALLDVLAKTYDLQSFEMVAEGLR
ncbi:MAG: MgtC/SapB family protein [Hyphomicrobium sp.]|uniref:MgtC/SapB family protein n=1 Tax=Hyphomicrobium sp. TaxID=82 RepID=UPI0035656347